MNTGNLSANVYPNPAQDKFTISITGYNFSQPLTGILYDCFGHEAMRLIIDKPRITEPVNQLPAGVYYMKMLGAGQALPLQKVDIMR